MGNSKSSPAINFSHSPFAFSTPRLQFAGIPVFFSTVTNSVLTNRLSFLLIQFLHISTVSSVEQSSLTISSKLIYVEYFYGDFAKIGLVLGEAYFEKYEIPKKTIFAKFTHDAVDELNEKPVYRLKQSWASIVLAVEL